MAGSEDQLLFSAPNVLAFLGQAVITTDLDGVVVYWNKAAEELYGWTAEEALGAHISTLTVPDMSQELAAEILESLRNGITWSGGFAVRRKDGSIFTALVTDSGVYQDGELVGIVGVSTNLGAAIRPLLERSTDAALILRSDAVISYASPAVQQLFGWDEGAVVGTSIVPLLHPEDLAGLAQVLKEIAIRPGAHAPVEVRVLHEDGWVWAEAGLTNLLDDPVLRGVVCNLRLNPRHAAQEEAETRAQQLQTALDSRLVIEQAKGFLAARQEISPEVAFELLRAHARNNHLTIHVVSRRVVEGDLVLGRSPEPRPGVQAG